MEYIFPNSEEKILIAVGENENEGIQMGGVYLKKPL